MLTIGITGGIASGKSEVARMLGALGARTVDADKEAHETYRAGTPGHEAIVARFGADVVAPDGEIDRPALGRIVFADPDALRDLTGIVWPLTRSRVEALKREAEAAGAAVFVIEAVALREAGWRDLVDVVWLVVAPPERILERIRSRGGLSDSEAETRILAQAERARNAEGADRVIDNDGDLAQLQARVEAALEAASSGREIVE